MTGVESSRGKYNPAKREDMHQTVNATKFEVMTSPAAIPKRSVNVLKIIPCKKTRRMSFPVSSSSEPRLKMIIPAASIAVITHETRSVQMNLAAR